MRRLLIIMVAGLMATAASENVAVPKSRRVGQVSVVDLGQKSAESIHFCSRPTRLAEFWKVGRADVTACERAAGTYLRRSAKRLSREFREYNRQYLGIERDGRRVVYLNAFYTGHEVGPAVMEVLVNACDGGDNFWGLVCDPRSGEISEFEKNHGM